MRMSYALCCMLYVLYVACCMLYVACCMLYAVCFVCCMLHVVCSMLYVVCSMGRIPWFNAAGGTAHRIGRPLLERLQAEPNPSPGADVAAARRAAVTSDWPLAFAICDVARRCRSIGPVRAQSFALLVCTMPCCPRLGPATT